MKIVRITIIGDPNTFQVLCPVIKQVATREARQEATMWTVAENISWSTRDLLEAVLAAAPGKGEPWLLIVDYSIWGEESLWDSDSEEYIISKQENEFRALFAALSRFKTYLDEEPNSWSCLPSRIVPVHLVRDAPYQIIEEIERAISVFS